MIVRLGGFALLCLLHLGFVLFGPDLGADVTKPLLMPVLAVLVLPRAPKLLVSALLASCVGDIMLIFGGIWFLVGMAAFAAAHVCYVTQFVRIGRPKPLAIVCYAVGWAVLITLLWTDLPGALRIPVACYSLLLVGTAMTSTTLGWRTGVGGALFLLSDSLIATGLAEWPQLPAADFWIMFTYLAGQYLLATGLTKRGSWEASAKPTSPASSRTS